MSDLEDRLRAARSTVELPEAERVEHALSALPKPRRPRRCWWGVVLGGTATAGLAAVLGVLLVAAPDETRSTGGALPGETPLPLSLLDGPPLPRAEVPLPLAPPENEPGCRVDPARVHLAEREGAKLFVARAPGDKFGIYTEGGPFDASGPQCLASSTEAARRLGEDGYIVQYAGVPPTGRGPGWAVLAVIADGFTEAVIGDKVVPIVDNALLLFGRRERPEEIVLRGDGSRTKRIPMGWLGPWAPVATDPYDGPLDLRSPAIPSPAFVNGKFHRPDQATQDDFSRRIDECMAANGAEKILVEPELQGYSYDDPDQVAQRACWQLLAESEAFQASPQELAIDRIIAALAGRQFDCATRLLGRPARERDGAVPTDLLEERLIECGNEINDEIVAARGGP